MKNGSHLKRMIFLIIDGNDRKVIQAENEMYNIMREYKDTSNGILE